MGKIDDRAIGMYEDDLFSLQMIGDFFGVTRQGVKKYLNVRDIDTSKRKRDAVCDGCGKWFKKHRAYLRNSIKNYCSPECHYSAIHNPDYNGSRQGQRIARRVVREIHPLRETEVVHHMDGNTENNDLENLMVFANQSDHMRWHRACGEKSGVIPVWRGIQPKKVIKTVDDLPGYFRPMPKKGKK